MKILKQDFKGAALRRIGYGTTKCDIGERLFPFPIFRIPAFILRSLAKNFRNLIISVHKFVGCLLERWNIKSRNNLVLAELFSLG